MPDANDILSTAQPRRQGHSGPYDRLYAAADRNILWGNQPTHLLQALPEEMCLTVLDAGCGDGINAVALEGRGHRVTGVDVSSLALKGLSNRAALAGAQLRGTYLQSDVRDIEFGREKFDVVISCGLFHCLPRSERGAAHAALVETCRPGGWILFSTLSAGVELEEDHGTDRFELPGEVEISELFGRYAVESYARRVIDDAHRPLVGAHRHEVTWVVARRRD